MWFIRLIALVLTSLVCEDRAMARTKQTWRGPRKGLLPPRPKVMLSYPDPEIYTRTACARTWSEALDQHMACRPSKKQQEEGESGLPESQQGKQHGVAPANERFLAVLGVVLTHMRRSRAEEDPEPLLDLLGPRNQDSDGDTGLAMRVFGIASRPLIQQQEHMSAAERTELWKELEEKRLRSRVREAMGPGLGSVVLGLCSTCRGAWAYRQADGWLNVVGSLAAWYRAVQKWKLALQQPLRGPIEPDAFHVALSRCLGPGLAVTRKASALLRAVYCQHIHRLCRLALQVAIHRGRVPESSCLRAFRPLTPYMDFSWNHDFNFPTSDEVVRRGCVVTGDDLMTAAFLLRSLRPVTAVRWAGHCGLGGMTAAAEEEEGDGGEWVLEDEAMVRGLVRALRQAGVVEVRGLQVLPRLAAELGHLAKAVAGLWQEMDEEMEVTDGEAALRALVEGGDPEETLARVLAQEQEWVERSKGRKEDGDGHGGEENDDDDDDDDEEEEAGGRAIDAAMVASALHSPQVGKKWRAAGLMQGRLGVEWQPAFPPDKKGLLQRLWLRELKKAKEGSGMGAVRHYLRFDAKAKLLIRYLLQQDLEAVLGAAAGVVAKVRASGYPDLTGQEDDELRRYDWQLCYLDLCLVECVLQDQDIASMPEDLCTGVIRVDDLHPHLVSIDKGRRLKLLDYMLKGVRQYAQRGGKVCDDEPLPSSFRGLNEGEHDLVAQWLCLRAKKVLKAMVAQMAPHYEAWAARAEDEDLQLQLQQEEGMGHAASGGAATMAIQGRASDKSGNCIDEDEEDDDDEDYDSYDDDDEEEAGVEHQAQQEEEAEEEEEEEGGQQEGRVVLRVEDVCRALRRLDGKVRAGKAQWWPFADCRVSIE